MQSFLSPTKDDATSKLSNPPRRMFTQHRRQLSQQQRQHFAKLASLYLPTLHPRLPKKAKVAVYYDNFGELPTQVILDWCYHLGYQAYLPVVGTFGNTRNNHDKRMRFAPIHRHKLCNLATYPHSLGMPQIYSRKLIWAKQLDVIFCPLVVADKQGNRMGMGGGYYDTTLADTYRLGLKKPLKIGWCYDFQVVEKLARQPWDVPLDGLITPSGIRWF
ncbi:5-formyltetrahydrofolate cyclo-ligase [Psychrobacter sp. I-STPA6b]|uniref:5-formyltetrahydrofolate cyclo-ligase n=1 Tax=Psychrobacter sp. I-STPA6b TaxID=2585718 RepID=UPI001D0C736C|nr:5-formyltetrahydrofolate cyclo-ligase [Psychrobacter sp. I-STPA6b]